MSIIAIIKRVLLLIKKRSIINPLLGLNGWQLGGSLVNMMTVLLVPLLLIRGALLTWLNRKVLLFSMPYCCRSPDIILEGLAKIIYRLSIPTLKAILFFFLSIRSEINKDERAG